MVIIREDVDQFDDKIRICAAGRNEKLRLDATGDGEVGGQGIGLVNGHIRPSRRKALILSHEITRIPDSVGIHFFRVRNWIPRIARLFVKEFLSARRSLPRYAFTTPQLP